MAYIPALDTFASFFSCPRHPRFLTLSFRNSAQVAVHSLLASRIFFNLRECDKQIHSFGDEFSLEPLRYRGRTTDDPTLVQTEVVHVT